MSGSFASWDNPVPSGYRFASAPSAQLGAILGGAILIVLLSGGLESFLSRQTSPDWNNRLTLVIYLGTGFVATVFALLSQPVTYARMLGANWPFVMYLAVIGASAYWSIDRFETLKMAMQMAALFAIAFALAATLSWRVLVLSLATAGLIHGVMSVAVIPIDGLMTEIHPGALRGLWMEKNLFAAVMAVGAFSCGVAALAERNWLWWMGTVFLLALIVLAQSATSLLATLAGLSALVFLEFVRRGPRRFFTGIWTVSVLAGILLSGVLVLGSRVTELFGREATFTGRTQIWPTVVRYISEAPERGYGFMAFWSEKSHLRRRVELEAGFDAANAHNTVMDILLGVGWLGLAFFAIGFIRAGYHGLRALYGGAGGRRYMVPFMIMAVLASITESTLAGPDGLMLLTFMIFAAKAAYGHHAVKGAH